MASHAVAAWALAGPPIKFAGSERKSASVRLCVFSSSDGSPRCWSRRGTRVAARCPYERIELARLTAPTIFSTGRSAGAEMGVGDALFLDGVPSSEGGVQFWKKARVSASTALGLLR